MTVCDKLYYGVRENVHLKKVSIFEAYVVWLLISHIKYITHKSLLE